ncbi:hypothetical protein JT358_04975 [Micrococcales bacterium 31B]|nr:hypothetical protein [Micrococcales bacterium 31B]
MRATLATALAVVAVLGLAACTNSDSGDDAVASPTATVSTPAADKDTATGALIDGFPSELIGPLSGSTIVTSSRTPATDHTVFSVNATTSSTMEQVQQHYQNLLLTKGYALLPPTSSATLSTYTYAKSGSTDIVTVTATAAPADNPSGPISYTAVATLANAAA